MKPKVVLALNTTWNLVNFRAGLIRALVSRGYEVVAVAPSDAYVSRLSDLGCRYVPLPIDNKGTHPGRDLLLLWRFWSLLRRERPAVFLGYTVKPNIYGSLSAHALGIPVVNNIAGLGAVFIRDSVLARLVRCLYRLALSRSQMVFFQNNDDRRMFIDQRLVRADVTGQVPGSGVDLVQFSPSCGGPVARLPLYQPNTSSTAKREKFRFLLIARMLWDKGVGEYVEAARAMKLRYPHAEFCLLGFLEVQNPAAIPRAQVDKWVAEGAVLYLGVKDDVREDLVLADCVVLPSYREGTPRTLLEAAAMAKPIITTDTVGCREVVDDAVNGYLCQPRDSSDLAEKMTRMIALAPEERAEMGLRGRAKVELEFDEQIVINKYLETIKEILGRH